MERYLSRCLDSLLVSSIIEYIEILVVNDGSKDQSSAIAHNYQERYPQSVKVIDKENASLSNQSSESQILRYLPLAFNNPILRTDPYPPFSLSITFTD